MIAVAVPPLNGQRYGVGPGLELDKSGVAQGLFK